MRDESSPLTAGNAMMLLKYIDRRLGADPPRKELGRTRADPSIDRRAIDVSSGNGSAIVAVKRPSREFGTLHREMRHTRSRCSSAALILSAPGSRDVVSARSDMTMGKVGQMCSIRLHWSSSYAQNSQIQATRRCEHHASPSLANMNQDVPLFSPFGFIQERMEYLEEGIVGDCSDCDPDMGHVAHHCVQIRVFYWKRVVQNFD